MYCTSREERGWFAQCLDVNIAAQGETVGEAEKAFFATWKAQHAMDRAHGREPLRSAPAQCRPSTSRAAKEVTRGNGTRASDLLTDGDGTPPAYMIAAQLERAHRSPGDRRSTDAPPFRHTSSASFAPPTHRAAPRLGAMLPVNTSSRRGPSRRARTPRRGAPLFSSTRPSERAHAPHAHRLGQRRVASEADP